MTAERPVGAGSTAMPVVETLVGAGAMDGVSRPSPAPLCHARYKRRRRSSVSVAEQATTGTRYAPSHSIIWSK